MTEERLKEIASDPWLSIRDAELIAEIRRLQMELQGRDKAIALLHKGMESQCELMDGSKQDVRRLRAMGLEVLDGWRRAELRIGTSVGVSDMHEEGVKLEYARRKKEWEG